MFSGLNTPSSPAYANRFVESYNFLSGAFEQHVDISTNQDMNSVGAVALPAVSKVLTPYLQTLYSVCKFKIIMTFPLTLSLKVYNKAR